jgi:hypothetical protein
LEGIYEKRANIVSAKHNFVVESGIDIYEKPQKKRSGKWKEVALKMKAPEVVDEKKVCDSVGKTEDGHALTHKEAIALMNALSRMGLKGTSRREEDRSGYRVWRII